MRVVTANTDDLAAWLALAAEVEPLFGPMADDALFHATLRNHFASGTAFCVRTADGAPGVALPGGLLWSPERREISWLAVASARRREGVAFALLRHALSLVTPPAEVRVTTFAPNVPGGAPARRLYERAGFVAGELAGDGPDGRARQVYRLRIS